MAQPWLVLSQPQGKEDSRDFLMPFTLTAAAHSSSFASVLEILRGGHATGWGGPMTGDRS